MLFVYSDYNRKIPDKLKEYYRHCFRKDLKFDLKDGNNCEILIKNEDTKLEKVIPLYFSNPGTIKNISQKYESDRKRGYGYWTAPIASNKIYYLEFVRRSVDSGDEYFPLFFISMDNWVVLEEIWKPLEIKFDYLCSVCDGCRMGGAYWCVNEYYKDFLPVLNKKSYWVTDHHRPPVKPDQFKLRRRLLDWGCSNVHKTSELFEVDNK